MVIRLFGGSDGISWTDQGLISQVRAYWEALREGGALPKRNQIDPRGIAGALENVFLIERIGTGIGQFRIAGFAFHDLMGMDVRGMPFSCVFMGEAQIRLRMDLERLFTAPSTLMMSLSSSRTYNQPALSAKLAMLPVANAAGDCSLALGCIEISGQIRRSPIRFHIENSLVERLSLPEPSPVRPVAQPASPFNTRPVSQCPSSPPSSKPLLRLVHSSD